MNETIRHRGPDDEGFYFGENFALGHQRLAILDLSSDGHQPMHYLDKYVIIYNGEIYNYLEIKEELTNLGYHFNSKTDTEVILAAYAEWGEACIEKFNGMWAFALLDIDKNIIFCSRDRFGIKPFYFIILGDYFAFGSEIKLFTILPDWQPSLNLPRAFDFLLYNITNHTEETFFKNIYNLRGGHNLIYNLNNHNYKINQWYNLQTKNKQYEGSFEQAQQDFLSLFSNAIQLRLRSDVKIGSCLSGGLDSSAIVCIVNETLKKSNNNELQETVSSCFENKKYDEQLYIDKVIEKTSIKAHKVFPKFEDLFSNLPDIIWHQDEPFGSTSIFAQWNVFKTARENNLTVMLDGQGADEILAGYHGFFYAYLIKLLSNLEFLQLRIELNSINTQFGYPIIGSLSKVIKPFIPAFIFKTLKMNFNKNFKYFNMSGHKNNLYTFSHSKNIKEMSIDQIIYTSVPMLLHFEDRDSMAFSIESRVPFLDYRLVEFLLSLPDSYKIENGVTKKILRESLSGIIPDEIKNRKDKMGFVTPEIEWMNSNKEFFQKKLEDSLDVLKEITKKELILQHFKGNLSDTMDMGSIFWRIIILAEWIKVFKVNLNNEA